jgi:anti-anti-sigma regulatory factor
LNIGYRGFVKRAPEGKLSSLAKLLKKLNDSIPVKEINNLIPTIQNYPQKKFHNIIAEAERFLHINVTENERLRTLTINLEGSLDIKAAKKLINRIKLAINKGQEKIILDFSGIKYFSPKAMNLLFINQYEYLMRIKDRIKFIKLNEQISGMMENLKNFVYELEIKNNGERAEILE